MTAVETPEFMKRKRSERRVRLLGFAIAERNRVGLVNELRERESRRIRELGFVNEFKE